MAKYTVEIDVWVTIEADSAEDAWNKVQHQAVADIGVAVESLGDWDISVNEPELEEED